jgi:DNA mismatch repair protein MutS
MAAEYTGPEGLQALKDEIAILNPREILVPAQGTLDGRDGEETTDLASRWHAIAPPGTSLTPVDDWAFEGDAARRVLLEQLRAQGVEGFGLDGRGAAIAAAGALVHYLRTTQKADLAHVRSITFRQRADGLLIDPTTLRHLEVVEGADGGRAGSLLEALDRTVTSAGSRLLRAWLMRPLLALEPIRPTSPSAATSSAP